MIDELRADAQRTDLPLIVRLRLRRAASALEKLQREVAGLRFSQSVSDEVIDRLASREREIVQREMAALRARIARLEGARHD